MSRVIKLSDSEKNTGLPLDKEKSFSPLPLALSVTVEERKLSASTLKQARQKAQQVLKRARQQMTLAKKEWEEAKKKGFEEGLKEAVLATENVWSITEKLNHDLEEWKAYQKRQLGQEVASLVEEISKKVLRREFQKDQRILFQWIQEGLLRLGPVHSVRVKVNRADKEALERLMKNLKRDLMSSIVWIGSETVPMGTCVIETDRGEIDLSLETQEKMIIKSIKEHA